MLSLFMFTLSGVSAGPRLCIGSTLRSLSFVVVVGVHCSRSVELPCALPLFPTLIELLFVGVVVVLVHTHAGSVVLRLRLLAGWGFARPTSTSVATSHDLTRFALLRRLPLSP